MARPWWVRPLQVVVGVYLLYGLVGGIVGGAVDGGPARSLLVAGIHLAGIGCWVLVLWRRTAPHVLLGVAAVLGLAAHWLVPFSGTTLLFAVVWLAPFRMRLWQALLLTVLGTGGFVLVSLAVDQDPTATYGIAAGLAWAVYIAAVLNQLAATKRQTAVVAAARAGEAVLAERQRMAREIHDILAHSLAAQVVHLEGTRMLLERGGDREQALERVRQAGDLARAGLEETKRAVAALRGEQRPLAGELAGLVDDFRATTGNPCELTVDGDPEVLAPEARLAVVRTAQEALTNVHKHAPSASVTIRLCCRADGCELDVRDTGTGGGGNGGNSGDNGAGGGNGGGANGDNGGSGKGGGNGGNGSGGDNRGGSGNAGVGGMLAATGSGYGLIGMRERAELVGGSLDAGPDGPGFRVLLRMPGS